MAGLELALRASLVLLLALASAALLRRRSAALRHLVIAAGLAGSLAVGPLSWLAPPLIDLAPAYEPLAAAIMPVEAIASPEPALPAGTNGWTWPSLLTTAWIAGAAARLLWLLAQFRRLSSQTRSSADATGTWADLLPRACSALGVDRCVVVKIAAAGVAPATWGWGRPVIFVPPSASEWSDARRQLVLLHELAHVKRLDWPVQLIGEVACAVSWFNPLAWIARGRLRRESERACDDLVLACGVSASTYGHELASIARHHRSACPAGAMPMARASSLERRIVAMLDPAIDRRPLTARAMFVCAVLALAALVPSVTLRLAAQAQPGSFAVQVFDPSGAVLPGVAIALTDARGETRSTATEGSGRAVFTDVSTGEYTIGASLVGFRTLSASISIDAARDRQRSITLQVGELTETVTVRERRPAPGNAPPPSAVVEPLRVGGNIRAPKKLKHTSPEYPASMRDAGLEGIVPIEALIGRDGTVTSVRILSADVHPEFARSASDAVRQWVFSPTLLNGEAVEVRMAVTVRFSFED
jgi:TonB family protein